MESCRVNSDDLKQVSCHSDISKRLFEPSEVESHATPANEFFPKSIRV